MYGNIFFTMAVLWAIMIFRYLMLFAIHIYPYFLFFAVWQLWNDMFQW